MSILHKVADALLFLFCGYYAFTNLKEWNDYYPCAAPIQIFLVFGPFTLAMMMLSINLKKIFHRDQTKRKYIDISIICFLTPLSFYMSIQGGFWQMKIYEETPECPAKYFPLFWIILLFGFGVHFIEISYFIIRTYWRAYQIRRRIENMNLFAADGDYQRFNQTVLELGEIYNENIGLLPSDIERLEKKFYQQASQGENNIENCAICLGEFNGEDKVVTLPRCEHTFHSECVATWLQKKPLCPMCRGNIRSSMLDFEAQKEENKNYYRPPSTIVAPNTQ